MISIKNSSKFTKKLFSENQNWTFIMSKNVHIGKPEESFYDIFQKNIFRPQCSKFQNNNAKSPLHIFFL